MFEHAAQDDWRDLSVHPVKALLRLAEANEAELIERENRVLRLACAWADTYAGDPEATSALVERGTQLGGEGTPLVAEFATSEFGTALGKGYVAARALIADALDLRHRLPLLWALLEANGVHGWQARKIAQATRVLSREAAAEVDRALAGYVEQLGWTRFGRLLDAAILTADPQLAAERTDRARDDRGVWATRADHGQRTIVARTDSATGTWFMSAVDRIAAILAADGDTDSVDLRRSKAMGWLAQPAGALDLLMRHQDDPTDQTEPDLTEPEHDETFPEPFGAEPEAEADPSSAPGPGSGGLDLTPPARFDAKKARPRVVLHFHLSDTTLRAATDGTCTGVGMVRPEHSEDPISVDQLREFLSGTGCHISVQPVFDPADTAPIDAYEISHRMRRAVRYRDIAETFPYGSAMSVGMDLDHTIAYLSGGPPGQTRLGNLSPLSRHAHRAKSFKRWFVRQPAPGTYLWRSSLGRVYLVTNHGTLALGHTGFSHAVWDAAAP
jgi:hypothetical protein